MQPIKQSSQKQATQAQGDPKSLQSKGNWGGKLFFAVLIAVLVFFWWLLIYSGGVAGNHG